jgi:TRAP-type C4-dicarboxylate transport system permease small subunit
VLATIVPLVELCFRRIVAERMGTIILSALVAHTGWHWMLERGDRLRQYRLDWPEWNAAFAASVMRCSMAIILLAAAVWLAASMLNRRAEPRTEVASKDGD